MAAPNASRHRRREKPGRALGTDSGRRRNLLGVKLLRELERRLESLLDGVAGRVFGGPLHPAELATRLARQLDLEMGETMVAPNAIRIHVSRLDTEVDPDVDTADIGAAIAQFLEETAAERGWRLEGPTTVDLVASDHLDQGSLAIATEVRPGERPAWAILSGDQTLPLTHNRTVIGRGKDVDIQLGDDRVSRRHAMVWREAGRSMVADLASANGTTVDGHPVVGEAATLRDGSIVRFGAVSFRYQQT